MPSFTPTAVVTAIAVPLAALVLLQTVVPPSTKVTGRVQPVPEATELDAEALVESARPRVFRAGTVPAVDMWPAHKKWNPKYFAEKLRRLPDVKAAPHGQFQYHTADQLWRPRPSDEDGSGVQVVPSVPTSCLFEPDAAAVCRPYDGLALYKSMPLSAAGDIGADVTSIQPLSMSVDGASPSVHLWLGRKGSVATFHYDTEHNVFVQVRGRKRFTLYPPAAHRHMRLHPYSHPAWRQAQFRALDTHPELYAPMRNVTAFVVDLGPGDSLYLPPMWFHRVEALQTSVSVNVWTPSDEFRVQSTLADIKLPFDAQWPPAVLLTVVRAYVRSVLDAVFPSTGMEGVPAGASGVLNLLLRSRFATLLNHTLADHGVDIATSPQPFASVPPVSHLSDLLTSEMAVMTVAELANATSSARHHLRNVSMAVANALVTLPRSNREVLACDHVEALSAFVVRVLQAQAPDMSSVSGSVAGVEVHADDPAAGLEGADPWDPTPLELVVFIRDVLLNDVDTAGTGGAASPTAKKQPARARPRFTTS